MDATVQVALVAGGAALISAIVTGLLSPHINWGIEKKKERLKYQRDLIDQWRAFASDVGKYSGEGHKTRFMDWLYKDKRFYSLKLYLSEKGWKQIEINMEHMAAEVLIEEIARIEQEWKLVPAPNSTKLKRSENQKLKELSSSVEQLSIKCSQQEKALKELQSKTTDQIS